MLAAPIMDHDVIFTLLWCVQFWRIFYSYKSLLKVWGGKGRLPIGQVSCRTPADWLYGMV